jgi:RHS repeat-associated protein
VNTEGYRFGFNGKENDNEIKGTGNSVDFGNRIYDSRLGRFLSVDPHANHYSEISPFASFMNNPIFFVDPDGRDVKPTKSFLETEYGKVYQKLRDNNDSYNDILSKYISSKKYNFTLSDDAKKVTTGSHASTYTSPLVKTMPNKQKSIIGASADSYYNPEFTNVSVSELKDGTGKTWIRTAYRSEIGIAKTVIHEAIHAKIGASTFDDDDSKHDYYNSNYRNVLLNALKEYNTDNKLGYSDNQLEALTWEGLDGSKGFKDYIKDKAKTNKTTYDEEYKIWNELRYSVGYKATYEKKEEAAKNQEVKKQ